MSTQETFGRVLTALADEPEIGRRLVTTSPDVSVSTNLGGWINKMGVFSAEVQPDYLGEGRMLRWHQAPGGQHIELGISEMNLFLMLHALGLGHELHGELLFPVGTVYDPFVCRGLDALIYGLYNGARFVVAGTPAGVTLAPEGGAHQSTITASIGIELPGITFAEPAFAQALDWLLCDGLQRLVRPDGESLYLRLSTRPIDQAPFTSALERVGAERLRADVLAGGYRLVEPSRPAEVVIAASGAVVPEACAAAQQLDAEGIAAVVLDVTSADRLYRAWRDDVRGAAASGTSGARRPSVGIAPARPGASAPDRHGPRRGQPRPRLARIRVRDTGRPGRCRRVRPVGLDRRPLPPLRPPAGATRQRRARGPRVRVRPGRDRLTLVVVSHRRAPHPGQVVVT